MNAARVESCRALRVLSHLSLRGYCRCVSLPHTTNEPAAEEVPLALRSVRIAGVAPRSNGVNWTMAGQDGGQSIPLDCGSLFVFSDTLIALAPRQALSSLAIPLRREQAQFLGNCAAISDATDLPGAMSSLHYFTDAQDRPREILVPTLAERLAGYRFWPQHGITVGTRVYLFYLGILHHNQTDPWGFTEQGTGLAVLDIETSDCRRIWLNDDWRLWPALPAECHCGVQLLREADTVYIFSSRRGYPGYEAFLARVEQSRIEDPSAYEFFSGPAGWSPEIFDSVPLTKCSSEYSVTFNAYLGRYLMLYADAMSKALMLRTAPKPWGPFSKPTIAGGLPHQPHANLVSVCFQHAQFSGDEGRSIVLSYSQPQFVQNTFVSITFE
jgi:Domain of unknown function (DUF4185)